MSRRRQSRSRTTFHELHPAAVELLEDKRLLSGVNSADVPERTITIVDSALSVGEYLRIEEVHVVDDEIWVLTQARLNDHGIRATYSLTDDTTEDEGTQDASASITVNAPADLLIVEFRIDGDEEGTATPISGFAEFHESLEGHTTETLFTRVDPELSAYRESVYEQLVVEADRVYADQFGRAAPQDSEWHYNLILRNGLVDTVAFAADLKDSIQESSTTNNQVDGVDEADIVETDGEYIYTLSNGQLVILSAADADSQSTIVSQTRLASTQRTLAMFLHDGRLTVISHDNENNYQPFSQRWLDASLTFSPGRLRTAITVFDVSDPTAPTLEQETIVDGVYQGARAIGSQVYVVVNNNDSIPYLPTPIQVYDSSVESRYRFETREEYMGRLKTRIENHTPPSVYHRAETENGEAALQRLGWLSGAREIDLTRQVQLTSVLQFDAMSSESSPVDEIGVRTGRYSQSQIYASTNAIYLANVEFEHVESSGNFLRLPAQNAVTVINKIDISGDQLALDGTGRVDGRVESQFSLDEHNGYLRIVTTTDEWTEDSKNHVYVLEDKGTELAVVGSILGLAPTERIYSARFDGDRAWMVTFRRIDPVFSLDLSDPTDPKVTGELKIPGFSEHLQLIDENHLLAIGRAVTEEGRVQGVEISLFDVSDMTNPQLLHRRALNEGENSWGYSVALHDHHAFNYLPQSGLLVIPYSDHDSRGLMALSIDVQDGIKIVGETSAEERRDYLRSLQVGEFLYGVAQNSVSVLAISDPANVLYEVTFGDSGQTPHEHPELLNEHFRRTRDRLGVREYTRENGELVNQIEIGDLPGLVDSAPEDLLEFEFIISELDSGLDVLRRSTDQPWLTLEEDGQRLLEDGTYEFRVRTRSQLLDNPEWSEWIRSEIVSIGNETSEVVSAEQLPELAPLLEWSEIADEVRTIHDGESQSFELNEVDHYEVWVTDAESKEKVLWDKNVEDAQRSLEGFAPGRYYSWIRAVFEDGTEAPWSSRTNFQIQGRPLELLNNFVRTADTLPDFSWQEIAGAESFEVEITSPDGTQTLYTADGLHEARHEITKSLAAGTYKLRVRALLASGVTTDWAESEFTILDRPDVHIHNRRLDLSGADALDETLGEAVEVWVNKAESFERVFHSTEWTETSNVDLVEAFGLTNQVGEYDIWIRLVEPDGQNSKWSTKQTFEVFHDAIEVTPVAEFSVGEDQEFQWTAADSVESYELFVQKEGQQGAFYRQTGITGSAHQLVDALPKGNYKYWLRGSLGDGHTAWSKAIPLTVSDAPAPAVQFDGNQLTWNAVSGAVKHELWVNQVDSSGNVLASRVAHFLNLNSENYTTDRLPSGNYSAWVKSFVETQDGLSSTEWSQRFDFEIASSDSDLFGSFTDQLDDVLSVLDQI